MVWRGVVLTGEGFCRIRMRRSEPERRQRTEKPVGGGVKCTGRMNIIVRRNSRDQDIFGKNWQDMQKKLEADAQFPVVPCILPHGEESVFQHWSQDYGSVRADSPIIFHL